MTAAETARARCLDAAREAFQRAEKRAAAAETEASRFRAALAEAEDAGVPLDVLFAEFGPRLVKAALERVHVDRAKREWPTMPRALAVERVLREADGPLSPQEITNILDGHDRGDSVLDVSGSLQYLEKNRRAHRPSYGRWRIGPKD